MRPRIAVLAMLAVLACDRSTATTPTSPRTSATTAAPSEAKADPAPTTKRAGDGRCDPMPKVGTPCSDGDSYCVESWGTPGGSSSALWCRGGQWEREEERNLPADEGAP